MLIFHKSIHLLVRGPQKSFRAPPLPPGRSTDLRLGTTVLGTFLIHLLREVEYMFILWQTVARSNICKISHRRSCSEIMPDCEHMTRLCLDFLGIVHIDCRTTIGCTVWPLSSDFRRTDDAKTKQSLVFCQLYIARAKCLYQHRASQEGGQLFKKSLLSCTQPSICRLLVHYMSATMCDYVLICMLVSFIYQAVGEYISWVLKTCKSLCTVNSGAPCHEMEIFLFQKRFTQYVCGGCLFLQIWQPERLWWLFSWQIGRRRRFWFQQPICWRVGIRVGKP